MAPASCITWNWNCLPAFIARVIIVNTSGGFQRIINIFKIKIIIVKLSLFQYLNNTKNSEGLFEVTNNTLPKKEEKKSNFISIFFKLWHVYHQDIFKTVCKENLRKVTQELISKNNLKLIILLDLKHPEEIVGFSNKTAARRIFSILVFRW